MAVTATAKPARMKRVISLASLSQIDIDPIVHPTAPLRKWGFSKKAAAG
jgi:hypothetical protein